MTEEQYAEIRDALLNEEEHMAAVWQAHHHYLSAVSPPYGVRWHHMLQENRKLIKWREMLQALSAPNHPDEMPLDWPERYAEAVAIIRGFRQVYLPHHVSVVFGVNVPTISQWGSQESATFAFSKEIQA